MSLAVVCVCNDPHHPGLARLARSLDRHGYAFRPVFVRVFRGFFTKIDGVRDSLPGLRSQGVTHVLATDAYDVLALGPPAELEPHLTPGCLFSAEKAPWPIVPDRCLKDKYPPQPEGSSEWQYVNSGGYVGEIDFLGDYVLAGEFPLGEEWIGTDKAHKDHAWDDQLYMASRYLSCPRRDTPEGCRIDRRCELFQTTGHTHVPESVPGWGPQYRRPATFEWGSGRVFNKKTGTFPVFVHGNGRDDMSWIPGYHA